MEFSSLVLTERPTSYDAGGVRAATIRDIDDQGALLSTRNNMDLAISGRGFLPVTDVSAIERGEPDLPSLLIRTGSFRPDENGVMRTNSGYALMGYEAVNGVFPEEIARESSADLVPVNISDVTLAAEPTRTMNLGANLDARDTGWEAAGIDPSDAPAPFALTAEYFDVLGGGENINFQFTASPTTSNAWEMKVFDKGESIPAGVFDLQFSQETYTPVDEADPRPRSLAGYLDEVTARPISTAGEGIRPDDIFFVDTSTILPSTISNAGATVTFTGGATVGDLPDSPTLPNADAVALPSTKAVSSATLTRLNDGATPAADLYWDGTNLTTAADDGGTPPTAYPGVYSFTDGANTWYTTSAAHTPATDADYAVVPSDIGTWDPLTGNITLTSPDGLTREVSLGKPGEAGPLSQFKAQSEQLNITKDGSPVSDVIGIEISEAGVMDAIFDSGFRKSIFKIPIGNVQNPNGLNALDGQVYTLSRESGSIYFHDAGAGPTGRLVSNALEESTTDIAEELTALIKTQRAYSSNAKIIQTVDEMLQETTNLKR